jgi:hypothetical protein
MAAVPPILSEQARGVLRVILDGKIIRGGEVMRRLGLTDPSLLVDPVNELVSKSLIEVTGDLSADALPFATFGTPPSAQEYLRAALQQR